MRDKDKNNVTRRKKRFNSHLSLAAINAAVTELHAAEESERTAAWAGELNEALELARFTSRETALLVLRINNWGELIEANGEAFGNELIEELEARCAGCLRGDDVATRVSDDEFTVVLGRLDRLDDVFQCSRSR